MSTRHGSVVRRWRAQGGPTRRSPGTCAVRTASGLGRSIRRACGKERGGIGVLTKDHTQGHLRVSRRGFLYSLGASLGSVAFSDLLAKGGSRAAGGQEAAPFGEGQGLHLSRDGGRAQPHRHVRSEAQAAGSAHAEVRESRGAVSRRCPPECATTCRAPTVRARSARAGIDMCEHFVHLPEVADELCVYRGCQSESVDHPTALFHMNTGNKFGGDPAVGSWVTYGLGSENQNLPGVHRAGGSRIPAGGLRQLDQRLSAGVLPGNAAPRRGIAHPRHPPAGLEDAGSTSGRIWTSWPSSIETTRCGTRLMTSSRRAWRTTSWHSACRPKCQASSTSTGSPNRCVKCTALTMRRRVRSDGGACWPGGSLRRGVRFVQIFSGGWDSHDYLERSHKARIYSIDKPVTALIKDLRERGLLDETLIVWLGEFGRSPDNHHRGGGRRDRSRPQCRSPGDVLRRRAASRRAM